MTPSRRSLLASSAGLAGAVLAGCLGGSDEGTANNSTSPGSVPVPDDSPVAGVEVTATDLVVSLEPDSDVSRLNLIAPDGAAFARRTVTAGATTVRIPILDPGVRRIQDRYQPGEHEVVVVTNGETHRIPVALEPDLRLTDARATIDEETTEATGHITVEVTNDGSGPSWVHHIVYADAPYPDANESLFEPTSLPQLEAPQNPEDVIIAPGESKSYVGFRRPLQFPDPPNHDCSYGPIEFQVIGGTAYGPNFRGNLSVTTSGQPNGVWNRHICSEATVELETVQEED
ncbi:hypothetical protein SAMN05192554_13812 [Haloarchaeobius iranensis]|uniref:Uncharacterized protein n=1 Tax=Haloarchaeobius iranensis TaxID=996166 RepID=A0A1H0BE20_9EURY|nr:hypothetical protein SAMN05192554_13812 [Haloarchaeobius iranensis]